MQAELTLAKFSGERNIYSCEVAANGLLQSPEADQALSFTAVAPAHMQEASGNRMSYARCYGEANGKWRS